MIDVTKFTTPLEEKKGRKTAEVPGRKTTTLSDENLKRFEKLQKRFPGATDSKLLNVAVECLHDTLDEHEARSKKAKDAKKNGKKESVMETMEPAASIPA